MQSSWEGEQFDLVTPDKNMGRAAIEGWITLDQAGALLKLAGQDFDALKQQAATREFKPVPLGVTRVDDDQATRCARSRRRTSSPGSKARDPQLKDEYVVYTAHWDHLGIGPAVNGDTHLQRREGQRRRHGAACWRSRAPSPKLPAPPKRSILFLAVTAEEQGLLGSQYYAVTPIYPLAKTLARHQHGRPERPRPHEGPDAHRLSARRISTTTRATPPASRDA